MFGKLQDFQLVFVVEEERGCAGGVDPQARAETVKRRDGFVVQRACPLDLHILL